MMSEKEIVPQKQLSPTTFPFGPQEYPVYMMLLHQYGTYQVAESGTQATGFINKCLQIHARKQNFKENLEHHKDSNDASAEYRSVEMHSFEQYFPSTQFNSPGVYFATSESRTDERIQKEPTPKDTADRIDSFAPFRGNPREITVGNVCCSKKAKGFFSSLFRATGTQVDDCSPCCKRKTSRAAASDSEESCQNMLGTISHIRLGPPPPCPAHGSSCTGPCKAKSVRIAPNEERARIKTSTVSNSRRGVFELVIRKLTGAPLARNELLLEWTPPPSRGPCCALPCPGPGAPCLSKPSCGAVKSKMILCKPNPCMPPKKSPGCCQPGLPPLCQHGCRAPCSSKPCLMCRPCVRPFSPPPCRRPSAASPCPAKCMRTCRVGKGKLRKKSTVKIRPHPKHKSPCLNRAPQCPVVRARSQPDRACCDPPCGPRLCRSTARCSGCRHPC